MIGPCCQVTPISNFTLAGDWTAQKFLGSMEGATLAGKLAAEVICDKTAGRQLQDYQTRAIRPEIVERAGAFTPKKPLGVRPRHHPLPHVHHNH